MKTKLASMLLFMLVFSSGLILASENIPDGFRGVKLGTPQKAMGKLKFTRKEKVLVGLDEYAEYQYFVKAGENLDYKGHSLGKDRIRL